MISADFLLLQCSFPIVLNSQQNFEYLLFCCKLKKNSHIILIKYNNNQTTDIVDPLKHNIDVGPELLFEKGLAALAILKLVYTFHE